MIDIISSENDFIGVDDIIFKKQSREEKNAIASKYMKKRYNKIKKDYKEYFKLFIASKKSQSIKKNIVFELDYEWFIKRYEKGCELTGIAFYFNSDNNKKGAYSPYQVSIDRVESDKGYTKDNSRLILYALNMFKGQWCDKDIYKIAENLVYNNRKLSLNP